MRRFGTRPDFGLRGWMDYVQHTNTSYSTLSVFISSSAVDLTTTRFYAIYAFSVVNTTNQNVRAYSPDNPAKEGLSINLRGSNGFEMSFAQIYQNTISDLSL